MPNSDPARRLDPFTFLARAFCARAHARAVRRRRSGFADNLTRREHDKAPQAQANPDNACALP
jgi:hypothetical protein